MSSVHYIQFKKIYYNDIDGKSNIAKEKCIEEWSTLNI